MTPGLIKRCFFLNDPNRTVQRLGDARRHIMRAEFVFRDDIRNSQVAERDDESSCYIVSLTVPF